MKKILIISESINVNDSSGSKVNVALIQNLIKLGYKIKVLHYSRKEVNLKGIDCINIEEIKISLNYFLSRTQRVISRTFKIDLSHFLENFFGHSFTFFNDSNSITKAIKKEFINEDLIITLSKGASFRPHYAMLKLPELHGKWLAYIHDPYPFHYYPRPYNWVEKGYKFKEAFFRKVSEKAKYSAFPSLLLKEWMGSYFPNFLKTGVIIPHQIENTDQNNAVKLPDFFSKKKFSLLHAGNLMKQRNPKYLIEGFLFFLSKNKGARDNSQLLLIGPNSYHENYLNSINDEAVVIKGYLDFGLVKEMQNNVSVNIILESKSEISPFLPGKFPHCVKSNKPILLLSPYYSETKRLLGEFYPNISEVDDVHKIASIIENLYKDWLINNNLILNRKDLITYLGIDFLSKQIKNILND